MTVGKYIVKLLAISQTVRFSILPTIQTYSLLLKLKQHVKQLWMDRNSKKLTWLLLLLL